jgi:hypothetical protein
VVQRVAGEGQPPALDRVGDDHRRSLPVAVRLVERREDSREVMSADIGDNML